MGREGPINCQSHFTIPAGTKPGVYALYWVWDFTKLTAVDPSYVEMYTSCMDVEVVSDGSAPPPVSTSAKGGRKTTTTSTCDPTQDPKPNAHTKTTTQIHTKTVTRPPKAATEKPSCKPSSSNKDVDVVYTTMYTKKFVTVTRTA